MISIFILAMLIFIFIFIILKKLNIEKDIYICFFITLFTVLFFINMDLSLNSIKLGLELCFNSIIPSIFSFSLICNLLIIFNGIEIYSKILGPIICKPFRLSLNCSFVLVSSFLCGYPLGAKYASDAYENNLISLEEYKRILNIASNSGPVFILGVLGLSLLGDIKYGYVIILSTLISIFFISLIIKPAKNTIKSDFNKNKAIPKIGIALQYAIENAIKTTLNVCGYVIAFSLIITILKNLQFIQLFFNNIENFFSLPKQSLYGLFLGSVELTNGCNLIANTELSLHLKISIISFFCAFGGMSVIFQTSSFFKSNKISILKYAFFKLVQGIIAFIAAYILSIVFFNDISASSIKHTYFNSNYLFIISLLILLLPFVINKLFKLFKTS